MRNPADQAHLFAEFNLLEVHQQMGATPIARKSDPMSIATIVNVITALVFGR